MENTFAINNYTCCPKCPYYENCFTKWIRGEKKFKQYCCFRCPSANSCYQNIPSDKRVDDDLVPASLDEDEMIDFELAKRVYICCDGCQEFYTCKRKWERGVLGLPQVCCHICKNSKRCLGMIS